MTEPFLTIFTTCRPFEDEYADLQCNAITSWTKMKPTPEVMLIGNEKGVADLAKHLKLRHIPFVERNRWGHPLLAALFWTGMTCGKGKYLCYCNADVMLLSDFMPSLEACARTFDVFLMVGPRWDVDIGGALDFKGDWEGYVRKRMQTHGKRHKPTGMDYFAYAPTAFLPGSFPALTGGGALTWDAWLVWKAMNNRIPVIEASRTVTAIHQEHQYGNRKTTEIKWNRVMANEDRKGRGYVWDVPYRVVNAGRKLVVEEATGNNRRWGQEAGWEWE